VQVWTGEDVSLQQLVLLSYAVAVERAPGGAVQMRIPYSSAELVSLSQTWPSFYELLPALFAPDAVADPGRLKLYPSENWPEVRRPSQAHLDDALNVFQPWLLGQSGIPPAWILTTVAGIGLPTFDGQIFLAPVGYYTSLRKASTGDGTVTKDSALLPNSAQLTYGSHHADLPNDLAGARILAELVTDVRVPPNPAPPAVAVDNVLVPTLGGPPIPNLTFQDP
jgi:hypothetical protein